MGKRAINETQKILKTLIYICKKKKYDCVFKSLSCMYIDNYATKKQDIIWKNYKDVKSGTLEVYNNNKMILCFSFDININKYTTPLTNNYLLDQAIFFMNSGMME
jgi:hypothetical protein